MLHINYIEIQEVLLHVREAGGGDDNRNDNNKNNKKDDNKKDENNNKKIIQIIIVLKVKMIISSFNLYISKLTFLYSNRVRSLYLAKFFSKLIMLGEVA